MVKICPHCGSVMKLQEGVIYTSNPPKYGYTCPVCGAVEYDVECIDNIQEPIVKDSKVLEEIDQYFTKSSDDDLEKAADAYTDSQEGDYPFSEGMDNFCYGDIHRAFKAGAEWMANSGIVTEAFIRADGMGVPMIHFYDDEVKELIGDKVVVQIRKK